MTDKSDTTGLHAIIQEARTAVRLHLREIARELLVWRDTGTLPDGQLRQIAAPLRLVSGHDHLGLAEKLVVDAALEAANGKSDWQTTPYDDLPGHFTNEGVRFRFGWDDHAAGGPVPFDTEQRRGWLEREQLKRNERKANDSNHRCYRFPPRDARMAAGDSSGR